MKEKKGTKMRENVIVIFLTMTVAFNVLQKNQKHDAATLCWVLKKVLLFDKGLKSIQK